jgi:ABC-type transport system involved in cytochrome c biogenesis permease subunit
VEQVSVIFLWVAFLLFGAAFALFVFHYLSRREEMNLRGVVVVLAGWTSLGVALVLRAVSADHIPIVGAYESLAAAAWFIVAVYLVLELFTPVRTLGLYVMPAVLVFLGVAWASYQAPAGLIPALQSDIVVLHVIVMFTAVGALYLAGGAAILYLIEERLLKRHRVGSVLGRLPSLATLDRLVYHATLVGVPFLTMGMVAGAIRAIAFGVDTWWIDPIVLLSLGAWGVYLALLYGHMRGGWGGKRAAWLALTGLAVMLVIRFAAVPFWTGFHTYGG